MMPAARVTAATIPEAALACFFHIGWITTQPSHAGVGVYNGGGDRLLDFVSQRSRQFSHHAHAVHACEICLQLAQSFALFFGAFALSDIRYRTYEDQTLRIFAGQAMGHGLNVFDGAVGHQQAMLGNKYRTSPRGCGQ